MDFGKILGNLEADSLGEVVNLVLHNREVIARLGDLPELFAKISASLDGAGEQAHSAAQALVGADGATGARGALDAMAEVLTDIVGSLDKGAAFVTDAAHGAAKVPLMDGPAAKLSAAAGEITTSSARLTDLAGSLASLADILEKVAGALDKVGDHLRDTGTEARGFLSAPPA